MLRALQGEARPLRPGAVRVHDVLDGWWYDTTKIDAAKAERCVDSEAETQAGRSGRAEHIMDDTDIWRTARALIDEYGDRAPAEAETRAEALLDIEDLEGRAVWLRVGEAAKALLKKTPARTVH